MTAGIVLFACAAVFFMLMWLGAEQRLEGFDTAKKELALRDREIDQLRSKLAAAQQGKEPSLLHTQIARLDKENARISKENASLNEENARVGKENTRLYLKVRDLTLATAPRPAPQPIPPPGIIEFGANDHMLNNWD